MIKATFKDTNLLISETFKFEKKLYVNPNILDSTENTINHSIAEILVLCNAYNVRFDKINFLCKLKESELESLKTFIVFYTGASLFNLRKIYGLEEAVKTLLQYMGDYGKIDIPRECWDTKVKLKVETPKEEIIIQVLPFQNYIWELEKIIESSKNPDSRDLGYLSETKHLRELECGVVPNRNVLKILTQNVEKFRFKCHTTASLRTFAESKLLINHKLRTSDKTFIMRTLEDLTESEVLDDFATNRTFWKRLEKRIIPTQDRFGRYPLAQERFYKLRNNDFLWSNNSQIENHRLDIISKFNQMKNLKSENFAIRNITKIIKKFKPEKYETIELIQSLKNTNASLKQLIELYRSLDNSVCENNYVKIKNKFWGYKRNVMDLNYLQFELKNIIQEKFQTLTEKYITEINSDTELAKKYKELPDITISNELLRGIAIPTSTDKFFEIDYSKHYITRGSYFELARFLNPLNPYGVFVAWKAKDNQEKHMDIDLSCNAISNCEELKFEECNYTNLLSKGLKHSGDWTSCMKFNPENPVVTAEVITVDPSLTRDLRLDFMINCFNGVSIKDYDVYVGLIRKEDIKIDEESDKSLINLNDAAFKCRLGGDQDGFIKLFTIMNDMILFEGTDISEKTFSSSRSSVKESIVSANYFKRFSNFDVLDLIKLLNFKSENHNPYKLNLFLNTVINL